MGNKSFAVLGLGRFGKSIAVELANNDCEVIAVDMNSEVVAEIADKVAFAAAADITDINVLKSLGISNVDGAIVAIGDNLSVSVMATMLLKELGVPYVLAKAKNAMDEKILKKVGADATTLPENEMGIRIARNIVVGNFVDLVELSSKFSIVEMDIPSEWAGHSLMELNLREKYGINLIAIKEGDVVDVTLDPKAILKENTIVFLVGENNSLRKIK